MLCFLSVKVSFLAVPFCDFACRPPKTWDCQKLTSWQTDEQHGNVPRAMWNVAMGDPVFWITCVILAHCASHVLLGWPDGSLVWILISIFEKAARYRLPLRQRPTQEYPPWDPRKKGIPVDFHTFNRDVRMLARQYFIPGPADFARMRRMPPRSTIRLGWKWNATVGIPLGETSPSRTPGGPRVVVDWPDFLRLLNTLDRGCTMGS